MLTLCIRYTIDIDKTAEFETYVAALQEPIRRCGGQNVAYYVPTKIAGRTDTGYGWIDLPDLAAYERYRAALLQDEGAIAALRGVEAARAIRCEDRSFVRRVPG
jgi:NIPSNAP